MSLILFGIPNCDKVRNARKYLAQQGVAYQFRDIRQEPLSEQEWQNLIVQDDHNALINTRSPSFRKTGFKAGDLDDASKLEVLLSQPTAMKRPAYTREGKLLGTGFDPKAKDFLQELTQA